MTVSFRARLFAALVGSVALLALAGFAVLGHQTARQVERVTAHTAERTRRALAEVEALRHAELDRVAQRLTNSIRMVAALDAAVNGGDARVFADQVRYELTLAELREGLVRFDDADGRAVLTLLDQVARPDASPGIAANALVAAAPASGGYRVVDGRLFLTITRVLALYDTPIGSLTLGFAVDDAVAARLAAIVDADVCFADGSRCLASSGGVHRAALPAVLSTATARAPTYVSHEGRRYAVLASALPSSNGLRTISAVPLDEVLAPFERLRRAGLLAAIGALLVAVLLGAVLSSQLTAPVRTLVAATARVRRGDYDFEVRVPHADELGTLAGAFNAMTQDLLLKERYRSVLDKVVSPDVAQELLRGELTLGGETREVTVLFADVRGFSAMSEHLPPAEVVAMLNDWLERAAIVITDAGGIVDKYVGDMVMGVFGAPMADADQARRAVRAALQLIEVTASMDRERQARGEAPFTIGVGVNTGPAVAGNMGSTHRLNYTVVGASVNAAHRLCAEAAAGEILIGERTYSAVAREVEATRQPPRTFKGFSAPMTPYRLEGWRSPAASGGLRVPLAVLTLATCLWCTTPTVSRAQGFDFPTLEERGIRYDSPGGLVQVRPSVRIEIDGFVPQDVPAWHLEDTSPFVAGRASLFTDVFVGRRLFFSTELRVDRGQPARSGPLRAHVQQAFVRVTPVPGRPVSIQAGKFATPFGAWTTRAHTNADAFIRPPLAYDHRTVMSATEFPGGPDGVFTWKDRAEFRAAGLPVVWAVAYPVGVTVTATRGAFSATGGVTTTAPSAEPDDWNRFRTDAPAGLSSVGRVRYRVRPELQVGASYTHGPYMRPRVGVPRQDQEAWGLDGTFERGHVTVNAEVLLNRWEVFRALGAPRDVSYYVEAKTTIAAGVFLAARYNGLQFLDLQRSSGQRDRWDYDRQRWQFGAGYRLGRRSEVRGEYMHNRTPGRPEVRDDLFALEWIVTF